MEFILLAIGAFLIVKGIIKSIGNSILPKEDYYYSNEKETNITVYNHITEQHLHVSEKFVKESNK